MLLSPKYLSCTNEFIGNLEITNIGWPLKTRGNDSLFTFGLVILNFR